MKLIKTSIFLSLILFVIIFSISCHSTPEPFLSADQFEPLPDDQKEWTEELDKSLPSLISPPENIPWLTSILLDIAEKEFGKELLPGRILTWSYDLGLASGALEMYIETGAAQILKPRLVYIIRMKVSYFVSCPFAIDVNSWEYKDHQITEEELMGLQGKKELQSISSFSERELTALQYTQALSLTPVSFSSKLLNDVRRLFSHEEIVAIASLAAKVNYWTRLIEAWRIKPIGYSSDPLLNTDEFTTFENIPGN